MRLIAAADLGSFFRRVDICKRAICSPETGYHLGMGGKVVGTLPT